MVITPLWLFYGSFQSFFVVFLCLFVVVLYLFVVRLHVFVVILFHVFSHAFVVALCFFVVTLDLIWSSFVSFCSSFISLYCPTCLCSCCLTAVVLFLSLCGHFASL